MREAVYIVQLTDGTEKTVVASTYQEVLAMFGEEKVCKIKKLNHEEAK